MVKTVFYLVSKANSGVWSLLDWNYQSKWDQICPPRISACWAVSMSCLVFTDRTIFDRVLEVNVLQRLWILINGNDSIAVSNFSSLVDTMTFGTWFVRFSLWLKIIPSRLLRHIRPTTREGNPYHHEQGVPWICW